MTNVVLLASGVPSGKFSLEDYILEYMDFFRNNMLERTEMEKSSSSDFELPERFSSEESARGYFERMRWPGGTACPFCGGRSPKPRKKRKGFYNCSSCKRDFTVKSGTVMERSKLPIRAWLYAMHLLGTAHGGVSSLQLSRELGVTQKTAWFMLSRIREAYSSKAGLTSERISTSGSKAAAFD